MRTVTLVAKNFSRRKGRSILSSIGLTLAIAVIVSTLTISRSMELQIGEEVEKYGPNIVVTPKTNSISVPYGSVLIGNVTISESSVDNILTIPNKQNLRVLSPKLYGQVKLGNDSLLLVGMIPEKEIELKRWWNVTGSLPQDGVDEILVGSALRLSLDLAIGKPVLVRNMTFTVAGFLGETGSVDDYSLFLQLRDAQSILDLVGQISVIDIGALCKDCPVEVISQQITEAVPDVKATPILQAVETRMKAVEQSASFSLLLASTILVAGCAGVMNTMLSSVHERMREIGVFMSLGADNRHFYKMFFCESTILGFAGGLIGTVVGLVSAMMFAPVFANVAINPANIPIYTIPIAILLSTSACLIASLYPTWRASKVDPVKALKAV